MTSLISLTVQWNSGIQVFGHKLIILPFLWFPHVGGLPYEVNPKSCDSNPGFDVLYNIVPRCVEYVFRKSVLDIKNITSYSINSEKNIFPEMLFAVCIMYYILLLCNCAVFIRDSNYSYLSKNFQAIMKTFIMYRHKCWYYRFCA